jgi:outer membrane protein
MKQVAGLMTTAALIALMAGSALAQEEQSPWQVRVRAIGVMPDEDATVSGIGGHIDIDNAYVPELDISYFFTKNIAAELVLATAKHEVNDKGSSLGDVDLGSAWLLPPTLTLQYHFTPDNTFSPYIGAGVNYTMFYNEDSGAMDRVKYEDGFGVALQAGMDYKLDSHWMLNIDAKKLWLNTDVSVNSGAVTADVDIDPWIVGVGIGYRF